MWVAVVPAKNEQGKLIKVLRNLSRLPLDLIVPVINGSSDNSLDEVLALRMPQIHVLYFTEELGLDVPRAIGAQYAYNVDARGVLFVDGDMNGDIYPALKELMDTVRKGADMALTNCYPYITNRNNLANKVLKIRGKLNQELGLFNTLGLASPSHGPHAVSGKFLNKIPLKEFAIPPASMAIARKKGLRIEVGAAVPHRRLGSKQRSDEHAEKVAHTIIGDCVEAWHAYQGKSRTRTLNGEEYIGYNDQRRFDILDDFLNPFRTGER